MFLAQLTAAERQAFLALATELVAIDGVLPGEAELLDAARRELGLEVAEAVPFDVACAAFATPRSRKLALMELMVLAKADGAVQASEHAWIARVAEAFGSPEADVAHARRWAELVTELYRSGVRFLDGA